jgi:hypothetical protein
MFRLLSAFLLLFALSAMTTPAVAVDPTPTPAPSNDAALYDLLASAGELSPAFDSEQTDYLLDVDVALELFEKGVDMDSIAARLRAVRGKIPLMIRNARATRARRAERVRKIVSKLRARV